MCWTAPAEPKISKPQYLQIDFCTSFVPLHLIGNAIIQLNHWYPPPSSWIFYICLCIQVYIYTCITRTPVTSTNSWACLALSIIGPCFHLFITLPNSKCSSWNFPCWVSASGWIFSGKFQVKQYSCSENGVKGEQSPFSPCFSYSHFTENLFCLCALGEILREGKGVTLL